MTLAIPYICSPFAQGIAYFFICLCQLHESLFSPCDCEELHDS